MSDKYDEAARQIYFDDDGRGRTTEARIAAILREAFPPVPDPRTGMDALDCTAALAWADAYPPEGLYAPHIGALAAEVRRLRAEADEVYELVHKRPVPTSIASMLCNMTERHRRQGGRS